MFFCRSLDSGFFVVFIEYFVEDFLELVDVRCCLEFKDLWKKFYELGIEMIIMKLGRFVDIYYFLIDFVLKIMVVL